MYKPVIQPIAKLSDNFPYIDHGISKKDGKLFFNIKEDPDSIKKIGVEFEGVGYIREQDPSSFSDGADPTFCLKLNEEATNKLSLLDDRAFDYAFQNRDIMWPTLQGKKSHQKMTIDELRDEYRSDYWYDLVSVSDNGSYGADGVWVSDPDNPVKIIRFKPKVKTGTTPRYLVETPEGKNVEVDVNDLKNRKVLKVQVGLMGYSMKATKHCGISKFVIAILCGEKFVKKEREPLPEGDIDNFSGFGVEFAQPEQEVVTEVPMVIEEEEAKETPKPKKQKTKK